MRILNLEESFEACGDGEDEGIRKRRKDNAAERRRHAIADIFVLLVLATAKSADTCGVQGSPHRWKS